MTPSTVEFEAAVKAVRESPFGYSLEVIRFYHSKAVEACKVHANGPYMESRLADVRFWHEELLKWEKANEAARMKDWSPVGQEVR